MSFSTVAIELIRTLIIPPLSLVFLYLLGVLLRHRYPKASIRLRTGSLLTLLILATNQGSLLLVYPLEHLEPALTSTKNTGAQAIVVLTAGRIRNAPEYGGKDIPDYNATMRIRYAAKLYRDTHLPILVTGGIGISEGNAESLATEMARVFENEFQIPVRWREDEAGDTAENAKFSAIILKEAGVKKILLVTDAMHIHRSRLAFEKAGLEVVAAPTALYSERSVWKLNLAWMDEYFRQSTYALHEWIGLVWYQVSNKI